MFEKSVFNDLPPESQKKLLNLATKKRVKANDYVIKEGDKAKFFYILLEGSVVLSKKTDYIDCEFFDLSFQEATVSLK